MKSRLAFIICVALSLLACRNTNNYEPVEEKIRVKTMTIMERKVPQTIECFGNIVFNKKIEVTSSVEGTIETIGVSEGETVRAGQMVAVLRNIQLELQRGQAQSRIASARASLSLAQARLREGELGVEARLIEIEKLQAELAQKYLELAVSERTLANKEELFKIGGVSDESISALRVQFSGIRSSLESLQKELDIRRIGLKPDDLSSRDIIPATLELEYKKQIIALNTGTQHAEHDLALAAVALAERDLESTDAMISDLTIFSPESGIIGVKYVEQGEYIPERTKLFTVIDTSSVYASLSIQEAEMPLLQKGQLVNLAIDALQSSVLQGRLQSISPMADPQSGSFVVKVAMSNPSGSIKPGMFVRASIVYSQPILAVLVPEKCIVKKKGSMAKVIMIVNQHAFKKDITIGEEKSGEYIVNTGLSGGDVLVISPSPAIREGMYVVSD